MGHQTTNLGVSGSNPFGRAIKSRISKKRRANRTAIARDPKRAGPSGEVRRAVQAAPLRGERTSGLPELRVGPSLASDPTLVLSAIWILALFDCTTAKIVPPGKRRSPYCATRSKPRPPSGPQPTSNAFDLYKLHGLREGTSWQPAETLPQLLRSGAISRMPTKVSSTGRSWRRMMNAHACLRWRAACGSAAS
jgi:hypothetical protein